MKSNKRSIKQIKRAAGLLRTTNLESRLRKNELKRKYLANKKTQKIIAPLSPAEALKAGARARAKKNKGKK